MKIFSFLSIFLLFSFIIASAQNYGDTIPREWNSHTTEDSIRLGMIYEMITYNNMRIIQDNKGLIKQAENITNKLDNPKYKIQLDIAKAEFYILTGNYKDGLTHVLKAVALLEKYPNKEAFIETQLLLAEIGRENDNFEQAITKMDDALGLLDTHPNNLLKARCFLRLADIYMNLHTEERFYNASPLLDSATVFFKKTPSRTGQFLVKSKRIRYNKILSLKPKYSILEREEYHLKAMQFGQEAADFFTEQGQTQNAAYVLYQMATALSIMGKHEVSVPVYKKALLNFQKTGNLYWPKRIHQGLFVAYSILGQQKKAVAENAKFVQIKDSIFGIEKRQLLADAETRFNTERIRAEKEKAEITSKRNKNYTIGALIILVLVIMSGLFGYGRIKNKKKAELITLELKETQKRLALEKQYRNSELKALKAQMNPHFIFNALNSIQEYIILNEKNLASDYLGKFADLMRNYLHQSDAGTITLQEEVESLEMYLELEALRFGEDLNYTIEVAKNIATESVQIPTMLVQPYTENALKHGLLHKKGQRNLKVTFSQPNEKTLRCTIIDNGIGRKAAAALKDRRGNTHKSFATQANENRLDLLNYKKNKQIGVHITDLYDPLENPIGTKVTLDIPL